MGESARLTFKSSYLNALTIIIESDYYKFIGRGNMNQSWEFNFINLFEKNIYNFI